MLAKWIGLPLAIIAFFLVTNAVSLLVGWVIPLIFGALAAIIVWLFFDRLDQRRVSSILNPPVVLWSLPLPLAWGIVRETFDGALEFTGSRGITSWRIEYADHTRGLLRAVLHFEEILGLPTQEQICPRGIAVEATIEPAESFSKIKLRFHLFSPGMDQETAIRIVQKTLSTLDEQAHQAKLLFNRDISYKKR